MGVSRTGPTYKSHIQVSRTSPTHRSHVQVSLIQASHAAPTFKSHAQVTRISPTHRPHVHAPHASLHCSTCAPFARHQPSAARATPARGGKGTQVLRAHMHGSHTQCSGHTRTAATHGDQGAHVRLPHMVLRG